VKYDNSIPFNNDENKSIPIEKIGPYGLRNNAQYRAWVESILTEVSGYNIHYNEHTGKYIKTTTVRKSRQYDFLITVNFNHRQSDANVIKYTSLLLRRINKYCSRWSYANKQRYIRGYAFLETHYKSFKLEGCLHAHIMCYFPDTFNAKPSLEEFESVVKKARDKLNAIAARDNSHVVNKARTALARAKTRYKNASPDLNNTDKRSLKSAKDTAERNLKKAMHRIENLIFADGDVQVDEIDDNVDILLDYVSKQLNKDNLDERIKVLGPNGLDGHIPSSVKFNRNTRGFWTNSEAKKWNSVSTYY